jgi:hypothetical protein
LFCFISIYIVSAHWEINNFSDFSLKFYTLEIHSYFDDDFDSFKSGAVNHSIDSRSTVLVKLSLNWWDKDGIDY